MNEINNERIGRKQADRQDLLKNKYYILTNSTRVHYCAKHLEVSANILCKPASLMAYLVETGLVQDDQVKIQSLFENPFLQHTAKTIWKDVEPLLKLGIEITGKNIITMRFDLQDEINKLLTNPSEEECNEIYKNTKQKGYSFSPIIESAKKEAESNEKKSKELEKQNRVLRDELLKAKQIIEKKIELLTKRNMKTERVSKKKVKKEMKKINEWDEKIIKIILDQGSNMIFTLGELLKQYFNDKELALLILAPTRKVYTLYNTKCRRDEIYSLLVKIISLIEAMEKEGLVYCLGKEQNQIIYAPSDTSVGVGSDGTILTITGGQIIIERNTVVLKDAQGDIILNGELVVEPILSKVIYYFNSVIYPSDSLYEFKKNNFVSLEILSYQKEVKAARCSRNLAWLALIISLFSPLGMTFFNNEFSKIEIQQGQYKTIIMRMDDNLQKMDSLLAVSKFFINSKPKTR